MRWVFRNSMRGDTGNLFWLLVGRVGRLLGWVSLVGGLWGLGQIGQEGFALEADGGRLVVLSNGSPVLVYQVRPNPKKPYVAELFSPAGVNLLRDSPVDHKHHHGLMFAVAVDGVNFWAEDPASGTQTPTGPVKQERISAGGAAWEVLRQNLRWLNPQGAVMLEEQRSLAVTRTGQPTATLLCWQSLLRVPEGKSSVQFTGSPYFGLGMRFVGSMDTGGRFFNAQGRTGVEGTNNACASWCAYTAKAEGKPLTVAVFDWPKNPRHPASWFTMDRGFAYMSVTLNLQKEPFSIRADQPILLRYGVAVWDGEGAPEMVEKCYRNWSALEDPK
jgi:hypothetical protein